MFEKYWLEITPMLNKNIAKSCAKMAVDEILLACDEVYDSDMVHFKETGGGEFWLNVKKEIDLL